MQGKKNLLGCFSIISVKEDLIAETTHFVLESLFFPSLVHILPLTSKQKIIVSSSSVFPCSSSSKNAIILL